MDGKNRKTIVSTEVQWPNGLSMAEVGGTLRIFWTDAGKKRIESIGLNGEDRRHVIADGNDLQHPFGLAVFENVMYWTDWNRRALMTSHVDGTGRQPVVQNLPSLMDVKVYHSRASGEPSW